MDFDVTLPLYEIEPEVEWETRNEDQVLNERYGVF